MSKFEIKTAILYFYVLICIKNTNYENINFLIKNNIK